MSLIDDVDSAVTAQVQSLHDSFDNWSANGAGSYDCRVALREWLYCSISGLFTPQLTAKYLMLGPDPENGTNEAAAAAEIETKANDIVADALVVINSSIETLSHEEMVALSEKWSKV